MKLVEGKHVLRVLNALADGKPVSQKNIDRAREAVVRDVKINIKRSDRSAQFFYTRSRVMGT